jgi:hypothetical protein
VRAVITEEQQVDAYPPASMENGQATIEEAPYANLPQTRTDLPPGYPFDPYTDPNEKVARTLGNDNMKLGPAITLKVMAGDKFNLRVRSWYKSYGATPGTPVNPLEDLVVALCEELEISVEAMAVQTAQNYKIVVLFIQGHLSF